MPRIPSNQQLEVDEHWVHPVAAAAAVIVVVVVVVVVVPGRVDEVTRFGRPDIPRSWVAMVVAGVTADI